MIMPMCSGENDSFPIQPVRYSNISTGTQCIFSFPVSTFPPSQWNMSKVIEDCEQTYNITPKPSWVETLYGGKNITSASNIVFR